jgi:DNA-binding XRE family transcriptional regulator
MAYQNNESNIAFRNIILMAKTSYKNERRLLCGLLVQAREGADLTQKQVADTGIVSQSEISKIENGQRKVEFVVLLKLAELYGKNINYFIPKK